MFNKIKTAVAGSLPGNPLTKDFEMHAQVGSAGPGLMWKIYNGIKKSTKQECSIFMFEKKQLDRYIKGDREYILDLTRKGVSQLTRLRHPMILSVIHPLEESREALSFATESVFASLSNVLGNHDNIAKPLPKDLQEFKLYEVEIRYGLMQVTDALAFLHNDVKMLHKNLNPEVIIINSNGCWKLSGFECCLASLTPNEPTSDFHFIEWDVHMPPVAQPHLDFLAPEFVLTQRCSSASDMFSLAVLIYSLFNNGDPLYKCSENYTSFQRNAEELKHLKGNVMKCIPDQLQEYIKLMMNIEPSVRPDASQFTKIPYFTEDMGTMTLQYVDSFFQRENLEKSQFFKGLPQLLKKLPKRVNLQRILPALLKEAANVDMIPFLLPNMFLLTDQCTQQEYAKFILPSLIPIFPIQRPIQILLIFMENMALLLSKTPQNEVRDHVLPMVYRALESNVQQIQELCLDIIPSFASLVDYTTLKNSLIPRIRKLCLSTTVATVRVNSLVCVGKLLEYMDKWFVLDEVIPLLTQIPSREPAVLMSMLGIFKVAMSHKKLGITKEIMVTKVLPFIIPLAFDSSLNIAQFNAFMIIVKEMLTQVETEQRSKLEQINSIEQEQKTIDFKRLTDNTETSVKDESKEETVMDKFLSGIGLGGLMGTTGGSSAPVPIHSDLNSLAGGTKSADNSRVTESLPSPIKSPPRLMNQPAQVSLTMAEKQQLAQKQEQQKIFKSQKPILPSSAPVVSKRPEPRDLTSSLINQNISNMTYSSSNAGPSDGMRNTSIMSQQRPGTVPTGTSYNPGKPSYTSSNLGNSLYSPPGGGVFPKQQNMNLSAFDNLLPSSNTGKQSLNQMSSLPGRQTGMLNDTGQAGVRMHGGMNRPTMIQGGMVSQNVTPYQGFGYSNQMPSSLNSPAGMAAPSAGMFAPVNVQSFSTQPVLGQVSNGLGNMQITGRRQQQQTHTLTKSELDSLLG